MRRLSITLFALLAVGLMAQSATAQTTTYWPPPVNFGDGWTTQTDWQPWIEFRETVVSQVSYADAVAQAEQAAGVEIVLANLDAVAGGYSVAVERYWTDIRPDPLTGGFIGEASVFMIQLGAGAPPNPLR